MVTGRGEFVWPLKSGDAPAAPIETLQSDTQSDKSESEMDAHASGRGGLSWWGAVERAWLCPTAMPVAQRLARAGWTSEAPGACCDRCGTTVGVGEADEFGCASCSGVRVPWERAFRLGAYEEELRAIILEVKFTRFRSAGAALGRMLGDVVASAGTPANPVVVVPIPMSTRRRLARGIDHSLAIARGVSAELGAPMVQALAKKHRPSQRSVALGARRKNVAGAFRLRRGAAGAVRGKVVVLVDDVRTSGATLGAASRVFFEGGAGCAPSAVWVATVGVTPGRSGRDLAGLPRKSGGSG